MGTPGKWTQCAWLPPLWLGNTTLHNVPSSFEMADPESSCISLVLGFQPAYPCFAFANTSPHCHHYCISKIPPSPSTTTPCCSTQHPKLSHSRSISKYWAPLPPHHYHHHACITLLYSITLSVISCGVHTWDSSMRSSHRGANAAAALVVRAVGCT